MGIRATHPHKQAKKSTNLAGCGSGGNTYKSVFFKYAKVSPNVFPTVLLVLCAGLATKVDVFVALVRVALDVVSAELEGCWFGIIAISDAIVASVRFRFVGNVAISDEVESVAFNVFVFDDWYGFGAEIPATVFDEDCPASVFF